MQIVSNIALISINETLFVQLGSFLIFLFIMNRIMFRPLNSAMREREVYVDKLSRDIFDAESELVNITDLLKRREKAIRKEAFVMKENLEKEGAEEANRMFHQTREEMAALRAETEEAVRKQVQEARKHLAVESEKISLRIMEAILDRRLKS